MIFTKPKNRSQNRYVNPPLVLFSDAFFSDVKVQVEAEDTAMMQQLKTDDFVCFG